MPNTSFILIHIEEKSNFRFNTGKKHSINIKDILFINQWQALSAFIEKQAKIIVDRLCKKIYAIQRTYSNLTEFTCTIRTSMAGVSTLSKPVQQRSTDGRCSVLFTWAYFSTGHPRCLAWKRRYKAKTGRPWGFHRLWCDLGFKRPLCAFKRYREACIAAEWMDRFFFMKRSGQADWAGKFRCPNLTNLSNGWLKRRSFWLYAKKTTGTTVLIAMYSPWVAVEFVNRRRQSR